MKKTKFFLGLFLGLILGVLLAIGVYFLTAGEVAWKQYLEEKLVPATTATVTSLLLIYLGVAPVLKRVINATSLFNKATDNVNATAENGEKANSNLEDFKAELAQQFNEAVKAGVAQLRDQDERIKRIEQHAYNTEKVIRIGFGNMKELVTKGYAAEIAKVGKAGANNEENEM